jgi:hypothetical protein
LHQVLVVRSFCRHDLLEMHPSHDFGCSKYLRLIFLKRMFRHYFRNMLFITIYWLIVKNHFVYLSWIRIVKVYFFLTHFPLFKHVIFAHILFYVLTLWNNIILSLEIFCIILFILVQLLCSCSQWKSLFWQIWILN